MRQRSYLRERYRAFLGYAGAILVVIGVLHLLPLVLLVFYPSETRHAPGFVLAAAPLIILGLAFWKWLAPREQLSMTVQEGYVVVVIVWIMAILFTAIPFMTVTELNFTQSVFESTSGWATVGLSVVDVTEAPRLLLFFRSFIQFAGGAGFAIITVSAIAAVSAPGLSLAEGRSDQLAPHVRQSASIVLRIYIGYAIFGVLALRLAGMGWFDAANHAFSALSTGGFSTRAESLGYWDNPAIEAVTLVLMILGATNFVIAYLVLKGKARVAARNGEVRFGLALTIAAVLLMFSLSTIALYPTTEKALRVAIFEVVSAITTTGLSTISVYTLPDIGWLILIILMLVGGGTGSTAGGIKLFRVYILYKAVIWEIKRAFMPQHMVNEPAIWQGERRQLLQDRQVRQIALFIGLYVTVFLVGSGALVAYGYPLRESLFEFASTFGTGMSAGVTSADMPPVLLWILAANMLLGRLEFFTVIIGVLKIIADSRIMFARKAA